MYLLEVGSGGHDGSCKRHGRQADAEVPIAASPTSVKMMFFVAQPKCRQWLGVCIPTWLGPADVLFGPATHKIWAHFSLHGVVTSRW